MQPLVRNWIKRMRCGGWDGGERRVTDGDGDGKEGVHHPGWL